MPEDFRSNQKPLNVVIVVPGRWYAFDLAKALFKRNSLLKLITTYPYFEVKKWGISKDKVDFLFHLEILKRVYPKLKFLKYFYKFDFYKSYQDQVIKKIKNLSKNRKIDILVVFAGGALRILEEAKNLGIKTVLECGSAHILVREKILEEEYKIFNLNYQKPSENFIKESIKEYETADYISIPSNFVKETFLKNGISENKLLLIPYGVDIEKFRPQQKKDDVFRIIFAGMICLRKGAHYLLKAFDELNLKNSELWLIGDFYPEIKTFWDEVKNKNKIKILRSNFHKIQDYYTQGSIFVLPSIEEGMARVILEAMACGLPVICSTNTGGADVIREGIDGFVIPTRKIDALKEKILFFYESQDKIKEMGINARKRIEENFSLEKYGERAINNYRKISNL